MKSFYYPQISYCFSKYEIFMLNKKVIDIAKVYRQEDSGWFNIDNKDNLVFIDEQDNLYTIYLRGRFWRKDEEDFDLEFVRLEKDGIFFNFDVNIFGDRISDGSL